MDTPKVARPRGAGVKRRKGLPHPDIQAALKQWRDEEFTRTMSEMIFFSTDIVMDDTQIDRVASFAPIASSSDLKLILDSDGWTEWDTSGGSLWAALQAIGIENLTSPKPPTKKKQPVDANEGRAMCIGVEPVFERIGCPIHPGPGDDRSCSGCAVDVDGAIVSQKRDAQAIP